MRAMEWNSLGLIKTCQAIYTSNFHMKIFPIRSILVTLAFEQVYSSQKNCHMAPSTRVNKKSSWRTARVI